MVSGALIALPTVPESWTRIRRTAVPTSSLVYVPNCGSKFSGRCAQQSDGRVWETSMLVRPWPRDPRTRTSAGVVKLRTEGMRDLKGPDVLGAVDLPWNGSHRVPCFLFALRSRRAGYQSLVTLAARNEFLSCLSTLHTIVRRGGKCDLTLPYWTRLGFFY
jgi:hypothetical protein